MYVPPLFGEHMPRRGWKLVLPRKTSFNACVLDPPPTSQILITKRHQEPRFQVAKIDMHKCQAAPK